MERLGDDVVGANSLRFSFIKGCERTNQQHHRYLRKPLIVFHRTAKLITIQPRHECIREHDVRRHLLKPIQRGLAITHREDLHAFIRESQFNDFLDSGVSPDGSQIGYRSDDGPGGLFRSHILDLQTGEDRVLPGPAGAAQLAPLFSPDGRTVVYLRAAGNNSVQLVAAPADGSSDGLPIGSPEPNEGEGINNVAFTPDGKAVVANYDFQKEARLVPIDGSPSSVLLHGDLAYAVYQRLAP